MTAEAVLDTTQAAIRPRLVGPAELRGHLARHGELPRLRPGELIGLVERAGLTGHGGAGFPTARKLAAVAAVRRRPAVIGNGAEGEPASHKDKWLLAHAPHLVLDGLQLAARAVDADRAYLYIHRNHWLEQALARAITDRLSARVDRVPVELVVAPPRFLAGEESAAASKVSGGLAMPRFKVPPVYQKGVRGAPTLVQNVETLAHLALIARHGAEWFRTAGLPEQPGTLLTSCQRSDGSVNVVESEYGAAISELLELDGFPAQAVLVGGYHGAWLPVAAAARARLADADLRPMGAAVGAGVLVALPPGRCGLRESARALDYLADESAGQCGPCLNGLPSIARIFGALAELRPLPGLMADLDRLSALVERRGACHHPDGTTRFLRSALSTFGDEAARHLSGTCTATGPRPVLPIPAARPAWPGDWR